MWKREFTNFSQPLQLNAQPPLSRRNSKSRVFVRIGSLCTQSGAPCVRDFVIWRPGIVMHVDSSAQPSMSKDEAQEGCWSMTTIFFPNEEGNRSNLFIFLICIVPSNSSKFLFDSFFFFFFLSSLSLETPLCRLERGDLAPTAESLFSEGSDVWAYCCLE